MRIFITHEEMWSLLMKTFNVEISLSWTQGHFYLYRIVNENGYQVSMTTAEMTKSESGHIIICT